MSEPQHSDIATLVSTALREDVGGGDLTAALIDSHRTSVAHLIAREPAVLCGTDYAAEAFRQVDPSIGVTWYVRDGDRIGAGQVLGRIEGPTRGILTAERTAINLLQSLSGTATTARRHADAVQGTRARVLDTRKTVPGLRRAQKYAVRIGGGSNHRIGLFDGILIKDNHIRAAGGIAAAVGAALREAPEDCLLEVEVESIEQMEQALAAGATRILLDNFALDTLREAVRRCGGRAELEASGNITLENIRSVAETGVDYISVGAITKNIEAIDLSLEFVDQ